MIQIIVLNIAKRICRTLWQRRTHSYDPADIKPILDSGKTIQGNCGLFTHLYLNHPLGHKNNR